MYVSIYGFKKILTTILVATGILVLLMGIITTLAPTLTYAAPEDHVCDAIGGCSGGGDSISSTIKNVINVMSVIGGVIAIIMIIIGGIRFVTSSGDSNSTASARNTIIYALVGLVVIAFAQVIVQFVLERT